MNRLQDKVALVTGGASGIGAAAVRLFVAEGCRVVIADVADAAGRALAAALGERCAFVHADHRHLTANEAAVRHAVERWGGLDVLFNNAGTAGQGTIDELDEHQIERVLGINLAGPLLMTHAAMPALRERARTGSPVILFTGSVQSLMVRPGFSVYGASKHGIAGVVGSLALELAPQNIRVNAVCPGPVDTPLFRDSHKTGDAPAADRISGVIRGVPLGRLIKPEEVANAAMFLVSDEARAVTGVLLPVDGGMTAR